MTAPTLTFPIVDEASFPHGLACMVCDRPINVGEPYAETFEAMADDDTVTILTCVYCGDSDA
jgi:hypothetical protein